MTSFEMLHALSLFVVIWKKSVENVDVTCRLMFGVLLQRLSLVGDRQVVERKSATRLEMPSQRLPRAYVAGFHQVEAHHEWADPLMLLEGLLVCLSRQQFSILAAAYTTRRHLSSTK